MNAAFQRVAVSFLTAALQKLGSEQAAISRALTAAHLEALPQFLPLLPIGDLVALVSGAGTIDNALDVAEAGATIVAAAFPPTAIAAADVKLGLEALQFFLDAAGVGPKPFKIEGGIPPGFPPGGGPGPYRGR